jgi:hypothetical protein
VSEPKSQRHSLAALTRWSRTDPDERTRHMTELSRLAAEKRKAERAEREARGEVVKPQRRTRSADPMPPVSQLLPLIADIQRERQAAGLPALSEDAILREASLRIRRAIAQSTYEALKGRK